MPENITCLACGAVVLGYVVREPRPIDGEECPRCGGTEFERYADGTD